MNLPIESQEEPTQQVPIQDSTHDQIAEALAKKDMAKAFSLMGKKEEGL